MGLETLFEALAALAAAALGIIALHSFTPSPVRPPIWVSGLGLLISVTCVGVLRIFTAPYSDLLETALLTLALNAALFASWIDLKIKMTPDVAAVLIGGAGIVLSYAHGHMLSALLAAGLVTVILLVSSQVTRPRASHSSPLGTGDILMGAGLGFWLSPELVPIALVISVGLAIFCGLVLAYRTGEALNTQLIPFIPALCLGFLGVTMITKGLT